jgi:hypothetical protein
MHRKIIGLSFLFCLIVPLVVTFACLQYQKVMVRKEVKHTIIHGIDKADLVLLRFTEKESQTQLRWERTKEFEFKGQMFDIVERETKGDTTYYWCWCDREETRLNKMLDELVAKILGSNPQTRESQEKLVEYYMNLYYGSDFVFATIPVPIKHDFYMYNKSYSSIYLSPPFPPPRFS